MLYGEIKNCSECPVKIDGFCSGSNTEEEPMCIKNNWTHDTNIDKVLLDLLFNEM